MAPGYPPPTDLTDLDGRPPASPARGRSSGCDNPRDVIGRARCIRREEPRRQIGKDARRVGLALRDDWPGCLRVDGRRCTRHPAAVHLRCLFPCPARGRKCKPLIHAGRAATHVPSQQETELLRMHAYGNRECCSIFIIHIRAAELRSGSDNATRQLRVGRIFPTCPLSKTATS